MPRPVWSGAISFGLVTIPIKVLSATENHSISFHQYHIEDQGRIRYQKVCDVDGQVLRQDEIGRGYETSGGDTIEITDAELDDMPLPTAKAIEIVAFVPADSIDPVRLGDSYYLAADGAVAAKPYTLLRRALERSSKVAVAKFAWHNRERLGLLQVRADAMVLHSMKWPDEIRDPAGLAPKAIELDDAEIQAAVDLMGEMETDDISGLRDEYRDALEELIEARAEGREPTAPTAGQGPSGQVVDLMAALTQSVQAARESRGEDATVHDLPKRRTAGKGEPKKTAPKKTAAAKKTSAKKTSTKKASAKKASAKKASAKKASAKKASAKKTAARPAPTTAGKQTAAKSTAKESSAGESTARDTAGKSSGRRRKSA